MGVEKEEKKGSVVGYSKERSARSDIGAYIQYVVVYDAVMVV